jgi:hypothetical protein
MAGFKVSNNEHLIRSDLWSRQLKTLLEDELMGMKYVRMITDFPDGETLHIPSIGQAEVLDFDEDQAIRYTAMDTGDFTFTVDQYKQSATFITEKMKQDSFYAGEVVSSFVPKQNRAIMTAIESRILSRGPSGQTASNANTLNGAPHRWVGSGTDETIAPEDFALARYALHQADVPLTNLVAIVHPSVEYKLSTMSNLTNISFNPKWEGIVRDGMSTGTRFLMNIYGFDVYVSNYLPTGLTDTIDNGAGSRTAAAGVANQFFSATPGDTLPIVGLLRQSPKVQSEFNKDLQREEYVTTCRYGFKLYRPENMVVVITDTDQVN